MDIFINGVAAISPQNTFREEKILQDVRSYNQVRQLKCIEPSYSGIIDPMAARRMSRIIKMGLTTALSCLKAANVNVPDAIVTGTGLGCLEDTAKFLSSLYENEEKLLNPTPFIQSTHNTVGSAIAQAIKCQNYNSTYCHSGFSFENALIDAMMLITEGEAENVLAGGMDELTPVLFSITDRFGLWKREPVDNLDLFKSLTKGTIAGEGAAFCCLSSNRTGSSLAKIDFVKTLFKPADAYEAAQKINFSPDAKTLVITGACGDKSSDTLYEKLQESLFSKSPVARYKHLCGEYETSSSFALYLGSRILGEKTVPPVILTNGTYFDDIEKVLIINNFRNINFTAILLSAC